MNFLATTWLFALIPWGILVIWVLTGRRQRERVPFLKLWNAPEEVQRPTKKAIEPPPLGVALLLSAILAGILAAAGPIIRVGRDGTMITVVVDRGASMSARGGSGQTRFIEAAAELQSLPERFRLRYQTVPTSQALPESAKEMKRTAADTRTELQSLVREASQSGPVIVLSDAPLSLESDNIIQFPPPPAAPNAGITHLSARNGQIMATIRSTAATSRTLHVTSGTRSIDRKTNLSANEPANVFVDLPASGDVIEASLVEPAGFDADDRAWIVRASTWPIVTAWTPLPDEMRRMLEVYARHRPAGAGARKVAIVRAGDDLRADASAVLLAVDSASPSTAGPITMSEHPMTSGLDLTSLSRGAGVAAKGPGEGWDIIARLAGKPILAVRETDGVRSAWVGFESRDFTRTPAFVVFWSKLLDWVGGGGDEYVSGALTDVPSDATRTAPQTLPEDADARWWPGVFRAGDRLIAVNAPPVDFPPAPPTDWKRQLARLPLAVGGGMSLRPWLALAALALAAVAAAVWERSRRRQTPSSASKDALNRAIA